MPRDGGLVFDWDRRHGIVSGPGAPTIRAMAAWKDVPTHPQPSAHELGPDPLRSLVDMAAILGAFWQLPEVLAPYYPREPRRRRRFPDPPGLCY